MLHILNKQVTYLPIQFPTSSHVDRNVLPVETVGVTHKKKASDSDEFHDTVAITRTNGNVSSRCQVHCNLVVIQGRTASLVDSSGQVTGGRWLPMRLFRRKSAPGPRQHEGAPGNHRPKASGSAEPHHGSRGTDRPIGPGHGARGQPVSRSSTCGCNPNHSLWRNVISLEKKRVNYLFRPPLGRDLTAPNGRPFKNRFTNGGKFEFESSTRNELHSI